MKVKYANGEISHVRNDLGRELVRAGIAQEICDGSVTAPNIRGEEHYRLPKPGDARVPAPEWEVGVFGEKPNQRLAIRMQLLGTELFYDANPMRVNALKEWDSPTGKHRRYLSGFGHKVPSEIVDDYARRWKENPNLRAPYYTVEDALRRSFSPPQY